MSRSQPLVQNYEKDKVVKIINTLLEKTRQSSGGVASGLYKDIQELQTILNQARQDLRQAGAADINLRHIPTATDELDAIIGATAAATGAIMDSCEAIETAASPLPEVVSVPIIDAVTKIYEACSFQDITGQRIAKIVKTLKTIESKVEALLQVLGPGAQGEAGASEDARTGDARLLNGPQLAGQGVTQADIDKLLSESD